MRGLSEVTDGLYLVSSKVCQMSLCVQSYPEEHVVVISRDENKVEDCSPADRFLDEVDGRPCWSQ